MYHYLLSKRFHKPRAVSEGKHFPLALYTGKTFLEFNQARNGFQTASLQLAFSNAKVD